jgi:NOL1/NOP2/fmu family ribosome biogenesis protein|tara:strand:+ start:1220 stop:1699 length:480 start_codon:yes stop_codon:yes gene_type:complete
MQCGAYKMPQLKILNTKEIKQILKLIENQWNAKLKLNYAFLKNNKNRIFIINKDISKIDLEKLRINSIGMYFCETRNDKIRLSIEGSQIVGPKAMKNIVEINSLQVKQWMKGEDLEIENKGDYNGFVIIKHNNDFLGTGKYKDGKVLNYVGKSRRVSII